jgi:hypothetical protein
MRDSPETIHARAGPDVRGSWLPIVAIVIVAALHAWPFVHANGWPRTHDHFAPLQRIEAFRRAFLAGSWFPIWTPFAARHYGSPYPLLYHRLFATLGGFLAVLFGSTLAAARVMTVGLLACGGLGMRRLLRVSGATEVLAFAGATLFVIAPYTLSDWIIRGAVSELTAMMLLPWLYADLALLLQGERHWLRLSAGILVLFHAHSMICYFFLLSAILLLAISLIPGVRERAWRGASQERLWMAAGGLVLLVGLVPHVIVASRLLPYFNVEALRKPPWRVEDNYQPLWRYLYDPFHWQVWEQETAPVEINRYVCAALVVLWMARVIRPVKRADQSPFALFLVTWAAFCLFLQTPWGHFVFALLPQASFLQFPWRLLSFLTIVAVFLLIQSLRDSWAAGHPHRPVAVAALILAVIPSIFDYGFVPWRRHVEIFSRDRIQARLDDLNGPNSFGEYLLKGSGGEESLPEGRPFIAADGCAEGLQASPAFGPTGMVVTADVSGPCHISIRQFQTPLLAIDLQNASLESRSPAQTIEVLLNSGPSAVRIHPRGFWEMVWWAVSTGAATHREAPGDAVSSG